jgi:hypothetical protein
VLDDAGVDGGPAQAVGVEHRLVAGDEERLQRDAGAGLLGQALDEQGLPCSTRYCLPPS